MAPLISYASYLQLRWLLKPVKRWAFARGRAFTERYSRTFIQKYVLKYLRKRAKLLGHTEDGACFLTEAQMQTLMVQVTDLVTSDLREDQVALEASLVATTRTALQKASAHPAGNIKSTSRASFKVELSRPSPARPKAALASSLAAQQGDGLDLEAGPSPAQNESAAATRTRALIVRLLSAGAPFPARLSQVRGGARRIRRRAGPRRRQEHRPRPQQGETRARAPPGAR